MPRHPFASRPPADSVPRPFAERFNRVIVAGMLVLAGNVAWAESWSGYRGGRGDGISAETFSSASSAPKLTVRWKTDAPLGFSSLAVDDSLAVTLVGRDGREVALALDSSDGKERWAAVLGPAQYDGGGGNAGAPGNRGGDGPRSTPAIDGDRVYVYDAHLKLWCLDAASGAVVWTVDVAADHQGRNIKWSNASSPVIDDGRVFVSGGGAGQSFLCIDAATGQIVWSAGDEAMTHSTPTVATIEGVRQVIFWMQSGLVSLATDDGRPLWRTKYPFSVSTAASPVVVGNQVYCSAGYGVGAGLFEIDADQSVREVWFEPNQLMNHWSTPVAKGGNLYGIFGFKKYARAPLQCVDLQSGQTRWSERGYGPGNAILVGDRLVVLSDAGDLVIVAADPSGYRELARENVLDGKCWSTPAFADGAIYVRSTEQAARIDVR